MSMNHETHGQTLENVSCSSFLPAAVAVVGLFVIYSFILSSSSRNSITRPGASNRGNPSNLFIVGLCKGSQSLSDLVLVVVVDLVVPEHGLVAVAPEEVLGPDVLVGVLDALLQRGHVLPVLPMLVPQVICVDAAEDQAGNDDAVELVRLVYSRRRRGGSREGSITR